MRAVKRERYGKKELDRLKKTLGLESETSTSDVNMKAVSETVTVVSREEIKKRKSNHESEADIMDQSELDDIKKYNSKTLRNENGAYPIWVHPRKIKKTKKGKKKVKAKGKVTKNSKKGKTS